MKRQPGRDRRAPCSARGAPPPSARRPLSRRCTVLGPWWQHRPHVTQSAPSGSGSPSTGGSSSRPVTTVPLRRDGHFDVPRRAASARSRSRSCFAVARCRGSRRSAAWRSSPSAVSLGTVEERLDGGRVPVVGDVERDLRELVVRVEEHLPRQRLVGDAAEGVDVRRRRRLGRQRAPDLGRPVRPRRAAGRMWRPASPKSTRTASSCCFRRTMFPGFRSRCPTPSLVHRLEPREHVVEDRRARARRRARATR